MNGLATVKLGTGDVRLGTGDVRLGTGDVILLGLGAVDSGRVAFFGPGAWSVGRVAVSRLGTAGWALGEQQRQLPLGRAHTAPGQVRRETWAQLSSAASSSFNQSRESAG